MIEIQMNTVSMFSEHIETSIRAADRYSSKCTKGLLQMEGMSGKKTRHFYNNLCAMPDARYLEIGTWRGSTFCSAICGNSLRGVAIDNWSYSASDRVAFDTNTRAYIGSNDIKVIQNDCWNVSAEDIGMKCNLYLYDGDHEEDSHARALTHFVASMDNTFIYIVDDWNDLRVRVGTFRGISEAGITIGYKREVYTSDDNSHAKVYGPESDWHNGICIFVLTK